MPSTTNKTTVRAAFPISADAIGADRRSEPDRTLSGGSSPQARSLMMSAAPTPIIHPTPAVRSYRLEEQPELRSVHFVTVCLLRGYSSLPTRPASARPQSRGSARRHFGTWSTPVQRDFVYKVC